MSLEKRAPLINSTDVAIEMAANRLINELRKVTRLTPAQKVRWPYELLQNARDTAGSGAATVAAKFIFSPTDVQFEHNGQPFSEHDLTCLTYHYSSKLGAPGATRLVGQFGTGLMAVYALSTRAQVDSVIQKGKQWWEFSLPLQINWAHRDDLIDSLRRRVEALTHYDPYNPKVARPVGEATPLAQFINQELKDSLQAVRFLPVSTGKIVAPQEVYYPPLKSSSEALAVINSYLARVYPEQSLAEEDWRRYHVFWTDKDSPRQLSLARIGQQIMELSTVPAAMAHLHCSESEFHQWWGRLLKLLAPDAQRQFALWPNRQGKLCLLKDLKANGDIPPELLAAAENSALAELDWNKTLLNPFYKSLSPAGELRSATWPAYFQLVAKRLENYCHQQAIPAAEREWAKAVLDWLEQAEEIHQERAAWLPNYEVIRAKVPELRLLCIGKSIVNELIELSPTALLRVFETAAQEQRILRQTRDGEAVERQVAARLARYGFNCAKVHRGSDLSLTHPDYPGWEYLLEIKSLAQPGDYVEMTRAQWATASTRRVGFGLCVVIRSTGSVTYYPHITDQLTAAQTQYQAFVDLFPAELAAPEAPVQVLADQVLKTDTKIRIKLDHKDLRGISEEEFVATLRVDLPPRA